MRSIPAVSLVCRDAGAWRAAVAALHGLAAAAMLAWLAGPAWVPLGAAALWLAWRHAPVSAPLLAWDGQGWWLDGAPGRPRIALDLGVWMLLRFDADADAGRRHWLPVSTAAGHWTAWRAALVASAEAMPQAPALAEPRNR